MQGGIEIGSFRNHDRSVWGPAGAGGTGGVPVFAGSRDPMCPAGFARRQACLPALRDAPAAGCPGRRLASASGNARPPRQVACRAVPPPTPPRRRTDPAASSQCPPSGAPRGSAARAGSDHARRRRCEAGSMGPGRVAAWVASPPAGIRPRRRRKPELGALTSQLYHAAVRTIFPILLVLGAAALPPALTAPKEAQAASRTEPGAIVHGLRPSSARWSAWPTACGASRRTGWTPRPRYPAPTSPPDPARFRAALHRAAAAALTDLLLGRAGPIRGPRGPSPRPRLASSSAPGWRSSPPHPTPPR